MGERKVLVRYIPPDFDPSIIPKFKRDKNRICEVRTMLPFSIRCSTCGEYMGRGKKFNSRKEMCEGDTYMGIRRFRFIVKCSVCSAQISFKTDPKNSDYEMEYGATRNFEIWKDNEAALLEDQKRTEEEEEMDAMKALENRTLDSKNEMDILDALDETLAINRRHQRVDTDAILSKRQQASGGGDGLTGADEALLESFRARRKRKQDGGDGTASDARDRSEDTASVGSGATTISDRIAQQLQVGKIQDGSGAVVATKIIPKKRKIAVESAPPKPEESAKSIPPSGEEVAGAAPALFSAYGSSSEDEAK